MKKIMFNDKYGLTKAVLEGRKTMTRRFAEKVLVEDIDQHLVWTGEFKKPKYKVGEVVAVAQSYKDAGFDGEAEADSWAAKCEYPGNWNTLPGFANKMFVQSEFMPHQIRITDVRVERLQDISEEDCLREGITKPNLWRPHNYTAEGLGYFEEAREAFATLIDKISGNGTWESNPWVFVYEFELVK